MENKHGDMSGISTNLLDCIEERPAVPCDSVIPEYDPGAQLCLQVKIDPGHAGEADIHRLLDALSELHSALGGGDLDWCRFRTDEEEAS